MPHNGFVLPESVVWWLCSCAVGAECAALLSQVLWRVLRCALQAAADEEPLALSGVNIAPAAEQAIRQAWKVQQQTSLYKSPDHLISLVQQVGEGCFVGSIHAFLVRELGTSWDRGVARISLVRL